MSPQVTSPVFTPCLLQGKMPPWPQHTPSPSPMFRLPHAHAERLGGGGMPEGPALASVITRESLWAICMPHIDDMFAAVQRAVEEEFNRVISAAIDGAAKDDRASAATNGTSGSTGRLRLTGSSVSGLSAQRTSRSNTPAVVAAAPFTSIFEPAEGAEEASTSTTPSAASSRPDMGLTKCITPLKTPPADAAFAAYAAIAANVSAATSPGEGLQIPSVLPAFSMTDLAAASPMTTMAPSSVAFVGPASAAAATPSNTMSVVPESLLPAAPSVPPAAPPPPPPPPQAEDAEVDDVDKARPVEIRKEKPEKHVRGEKSVMVCRHWKSKGWCRMEDGCKFLHPDHKRGTGAPMTGGNGDKATTTATTTTAITPVAPAGNTDDGSSSTANAINASTTKSSRSARRKAKNNDRAEAGPISMTAALTACTAGTMGAGSLAVGTEGAALTSDMPAQIVSAECYAAAAHDMAAAAGFMQAPPPPPPHLWPIQAVGFPQEQAEMTAALAAASAWGGSFHPYTAWGDPLDHAGASS